MSPNYHPLKIDIVTILCLTFVLFTSYFTYFHNFWQPQAFYWDENYHVSSAQKYLNGTFFMEQHPPLGKILIAAGEKIINFSSNDTQFLDTDYAKGNFGDGFSITGYRFIPALLGWMAAVLFFLIFLLITDSPILAALLSFLYIFDNALIVQIRGAMLEGPLVFFIVASVLSALLLWKRRLPAWQENITAVLLGISIACAFTTKLTGLILILLIPPLLLSMIPERKKIVRLLSLILLGFILTYCMVWNIHFLLGRELNDELNNKGWYRASEQYKEIVLEGKQASPLSFSTMLRDNVRYPFFYSKGVPKLNLCKPDENGSPFFFWPFGGRTINYRWATSGNGTYRYLYLVANPAGWTMGFLGVVLAIAFLLSHLFLPIRTKLKQPLLLVTILSMYIGYMFVMSRLDRVMYLYHYFPPLLFSFLLWSIVLMEIRRIWRWKVSEDGRILGTMVCMLILFLSFQFYRPLTYYQPLTDEQFQRRSLLRIWNMRCIKCERDNSIAKPKSCASDR